jgi:PTH1 family peptidyl-tRNA hydrolase
MRRIEYTMNERIAVLTKKSSNNVSLAMELIVALGNPGKEYEHTRHNVAWIVLRALMNGAGLPEPHTSSAFSGEVSVGNLHGKEVRILFPTTFMNNSGSAVKKALECEPLSSLIVIHDEVDLPLGTIRIAEGRGAGGHNGVKSIIESIGSKDFVRIRIGIARKNIFGMRVRPTGDKLSDFVLGEFGTKEKGVLEEVGKKVMRAIELIYSKDVKTAMNEVNS